MTLQKKAMALSFITITILIAGAYANHIETFIQNQASLIFQEDFKAVYSPFTDARIADRERLFIQIDQVLQFKSRLSGLVTVKSVAKHNSESWNKIVEQILILDKHLRPTSCLSDGDIDKNLSGMTAESVEVAVDTLSSLIGLLGGKDKNVNLAVHYFAILLTSFVTNPDELLDITDRPEDVDDIHPVSTSVIPSFILVLETRQYISSHSAYYQQQYRKFFSDADVPITDRKVAKGKTKRDLEEDILREPDLCTLGLVVPPLGFIHCLCTRLVNTCRLKWGMSSHAAVNLVAYLSWYCEERKKGLKSGPNLAKAPYLLEQNPAPSWPRAAPSPRSPLWLSNLHVKIPRFPRSPGSPQLPTKKSCPDTAHTYESFDDLFKTAPTDTITVN